MKQTVCVTWGLLEDIAVFCVFTLVFGAYLEVKNAELSVLKSKFCYRLSLIDF